MSNEPDTPLTVTMSSWEWHNLLSRLEEDMCVVNRDQETTYRLYETIASQLAGHTVTIERPKRAQPKMPIAPVASAKSPSLWSRMKKWNWSCLPSDF